MKPTKINILGTEWVVMYYNSASEVDVDRRKSLWGQSDFWKKIIRIYDDGRGEDAIMQVIFHEILHVLVYELRIKEISDAPREEDIIDLLGTGLSDLIMRNGWLNDNHSID